MCGPELCCSVFAAQVTPASVVTKLGTELYKIKLFVSQIKTMRAHSAVVAQSVNAIQCRLEKLLIPWMVKEHPPTLRNSQFRYLVRNSQPHGRIMRPINPTQRLASHFLNIHFNIILQCIPGFSEWLFPLGTSSITLHAALSVQYVGRCETQEQINK